MVDVEYLGVVPGAAKVVPPHRPQKKKFLYIYFNIVATVVHVNSKSFSKMNKLRYIKPIMGVDLSNGFEYLPNSLRILEWSKFSLKSLPSSFYPEHEHLRELSMWHSDLEYLWREINVSSLLFIFLTYSTFWIIWKLILLRFHFMSAVTQFEKDWSPLLFKSCQDPRL